ncbi:fructokinase [Erysipelotrichaceae bacterium]|nr:fructokinase [Erysipelotrichaceae bacterium]
MNNKIKIVVAGNFTIDDMVLPDGRTSMNVAGGDVLYGALGARFWVDGIGMLSRAGEQFSQQNLDACVLAGLDISGVSIHSGDDVRNWIIYENDGRRNFIYRTDPQRFHDLSPEACDVPEAYKQASCIFLAAMPINNQLALAKVFKAAGVTVLFDPHEEDASDNKSLVYDTLKYTDIFMPSEEEAYRLHHSRDYKEIAKHFAQHGPETVIIKLGSKGCLVYQKSLDCYTTLPCFDTQAIDVTGAGDAFGGGFTAGFALTNNVVTSAMYGTVSASFAIEDFGSIQLSSKNKSDAVARLDEYKKKYINL